MRLPSAVLLVVSILNQGCFLASLEKSEASEEMDDPNTRKLSSTSKNNLSLISPFRNHSKTSERSVTSLSPEKASASSLAMRNAWKLNRLKRDGNTQFSTNELTLQRKHVYTTESGFPESFSSIDSIIDQTTTKVADPEGHITTAADSVVPIPAEKPQTAEVLGQQNTKAGGDFGQESITQQVTVENVAQSSEKSSAQNVIDPGTPDSGGTTLIPEPFEIFSQESNIFNATLDPQLTRGTEATSQAPEPFEIFQDPDSTNTISILGTRVTTGTEGTTQAPEPFEIYGLSTGDMADKSTLDLPKTTELKHQSQGPIETSERSIENLPSTKVEQLAKTTEPHKDGLVQDTLETKQAPVSLKIVDLSSADLFENSTPVLQKSSKMEHNTLSKTPIETSERSIEILPSTSVKQLAKTAEPHKDELLRDILDLVSHKSDIATTDHVDTSIKSSAGAQVTKGQGPYGVGQLNFESSTTKTDEDTGKSDLEAIMSVRQYSTEASIPTVASAIKTDSGETWDMHIFKPLENKKTNQTKENSGGLISIVDGDSGVSEKDNGTMAKAVKDGEGSGEDPSAPGKEPSDDAQKDGTKEDPSESDKRPSNDAQKDGVSSQEDSSAPAKEPSDGIQNDEQKPGEALGQSNQTDTQDGDVVAGGNGTTANMVNGEKISSSETSSLTEGQAPSTPSKISSVGIQNAYEKNTTDVSSKPDNATSIPKPQLPTPKAADRTWPRLRTTRITRAPTKRLSAPVSPKPSPTGNETDFSNATIWQLYTFEETVNADIIIIIALIGVLVLLVVLIIICLGIRNEKKHDRIRRELLRQEMLEEEKLFDEYRRRRAASRPSSLKVQPTPEGATKETRVEMDGRVPGPATGALQTTLTHTSDIEIQTLDESAVEVYNDGNTCIKMKRPKRGRCKY